MENLRNFPHRTFFLYVLVRNQQFLDIADVLSEGTVSIDEVADGVAGVENRSVVLAADLGTDRSKRDFGKITAQIHGYLTGLDDLSLTGFRKDGIVGKIEIIADDILYAGDSDFILAVSHYLLYQLLGELESHIALGKRSLGDEREQRAFQLPDIGLHLAGDELEHLVGNDCALAETLVLEDCQPRLV